MSTESNPIPALADTDAAPFDACWNRIGVRGDSSCTELAHVVRCLNCAVFARGAAQLLDRVPTVARAATADQPLSTPLQAGEHAAPGNAAAASFLMFRLGDEWLGLPTELFREVSEMRKLHPMPHRRHLAALGVVNIRGRLLLCLSLARLLGIDMPEPAASEADAADAGAAPTRRRLLVISHDGLNSVFPVDEVLGVQQVQAHARAMVPASLKHAAAHFSGSTTSWQGKTVGLLDAARLLAAFSRSLA